MNKFLSLLISLALILSSFTFAFASDYEGHWAEKVTDELLYEGIISGDANGMRLDDKIKRSEFVTLVNNAFNFEETGTVNFPDVEADKWYFNEFLTAKQAGYLTGDALGNANPEAYIKRIETFVILYRLLGFNNEKNIADFKDDADIAEWGKASLYTLASKGIIKGYSDGTIKPSNTLTRAEAFTLMYNAKYAGNITNKEEEGSVIVETVINTNTAVSGGAGGGGGGGGGGGTGGAGSSGTPAAPTLQFSRADEESNTVYWNTFSGASSYKIKVERLTENTDTSLSVEDVTTQSSYNLTELVKQIAPSSDRVPQESVKITLSCTVGSTTYTAVENMKVSFPNVKKPEIKVVSEDNNGAEKLYFSWENDENAVSYTFKVNLDNTVKQVLSYNVVDGKCIAEIPQSYYGSLAKTFEYDMEATTSDVEEIVPLRPYSDKVDNLLYASGSGTITAPYVIKFLRHFKNIAENPSAYYYLASDLTLDQTLSETDANKYSLIALFSGSLVGYDTQAEEEKVRTLTVESRNGIGVFEKIDNATIKNIKLLGTVTTEANVTRASVFAGESVNTNSFTNCESAAEMTVELEGSGAAGGLLGYNAGVTTFTDCYNSKDLTVTTTGTSYLGGLCGANANVSSQRITFTSCKNSGNISSSASSAAGIIASVRSITISECNNIGNVSANTYAGGLIATTHSNGSVTIDSSYNSGSVSAATAGGLSGYVNGTATVSNSYNSGAVTATTAGKLIGNATTATLTNCYDATTSSAVFAKATTLTNSNCYYLSSQTAAAENGLKPLSEADMKLRESFRDFEFGSVWTFGSGAYKYPQLAQNLHIFLAEHLTTPVIEIVLTRNSAILKITGSSNATGYLVSINGNEFLVSGGGNKEEDISSYITEIGAYTVTVKALGDDELYQSSSLATKSFEKELFKFAPSITSVTGDENDAYTVKWTVNETEGLSGYLVSVLDKETLTDILTDEPVAADKSSYKITDAIGFVPGKEYIFKIKAIGTNPEESTDDYVTKEFKTLYATEEAPYVLKNARHFANISLNPSAEYHLASDIAIDQTLATGAYIPVSTFGGKLIGYNSELTAEEVRTIDITSNTGVGLFAAVSGATIKNIKTTGEVTGYSLYAGAFAGNATNSTFENCENAAEIEITVPSGNAMVGGIAGNHNAGGALNFINCKNTADITIDGGSTVHIGGIIGYNNISTLVTLSKCSNSGDIRGKAAGGLVGYAKRASVNASFNTGDIITTTNAGGIMGSCSTNAISINNSYNNGTIEGGTGSSSNAGGIVGNISASVSVSNCYNTGAVTTGTNKGEIAGKSGTGTITNCYYLADTTGVMTNGLRALSPSDMTNKDNFSYTEEVEGVSTTYSFDFDTVWNEPDSSATYKYPTLK